MKTRIFILISLLLTIAGCSKPTPYVPPPHNELATIKLTEAATNASQSLDRLAAVEQAIHPRAKIVPPPTPASYGMARRASLDWAGPIQPIVKRIAEETGYKLKVLGNPPAIPVLVSLNVQDQALGDILRNIGYQADKRAHIYVFPATHVVELRYARP